MTKGLFFSALASLALLLGGCTAVNNMTNPGPINENYGERTRGMQVEDGSIENKIETNLSSTDARFNDARISVDSYNGIVLLSGQVPSQELKDQAGEIANQVRRVRRVHNELSVTANLPIGQRINDGWISTRVKAELAGHEQIESNRIQVITENSTVYLMGMLTREEADRVVNVVSQVGGVQRIVKAFEYID